MNVGLTYDLKDDYLAEGWSQEAAAEFDSPRTIEAIEDVLRGAGHRVDRIGHARALMTRLVDGDRWDLVFNIAEGTYGPAREAQVPCILDVHGIRYTFSDGLVLAVCLHKGLTKTLVRAAGVPTADHVVVEHPEEASAVSLSMPLFVKPVAEGTGKGVDGLSLVETGAQLVRSCRTLLERFHQPVLVERYLPGRELTVGILGTGPRARALGALEVLLGDDAERGGYTYTNKRDYERLVSYRSAVDATAQRAQQVALAAWRALGCRDGGRVDLRCDADGNPHFLEVNPLAGLHPEHSDLPILCGLTGMGYRDLVLAIMDSALQRPAPVLPGLTTEAADR